ncbi:MAG: transglutaminase domain-containing protein, partial [Acidobacteriota bacterium]
MSAETERTDRRRRVVRRLRALVMATAAVVLCWPLSVTWGVVAAAVGAAVGAVWGDRAARSPLRLPSTLALTATFFAVGWLVTRLVVGSGLLAGLLGPVVTLVIGEILLWFTVAAATAFVLRLLAVRRPTLAILEVAAVAGATAAGFAAHRQGMVHRPLEIGDWAWSRGFDPALVFLVLGGLGTLLLAALMVQETRRRRLPLHFATLVAIAFLMIFFVRVEGLPQPDPAGDLGLTGEPEDGDEGDGAEGGGGGESDRHELGDLDFRDDYGNSGQQAPVAVVVLHDDYTPPTGIFYFRQAAFSQYNGHRLVQTTRDDVDGDVVRRFPFEEIVVENAPEVGSDRRALITTMGLMVDHVRPFALDSPSRLMPAANPNPMRFRRTFQVRSHVPTERYEELLGRRPGDPSWSDEQWQHYTRAPVDARYRDLASQLMDYLAPDYRDDPLGQALAIKTYLDQEGIYSRQSRHADAADPAASFLFGDLTGYCVHFAHAATYLFRSIGLPARVAAGYAVSESDRAGGSALLIRGG